MLCYHSQPNVIMKFYLSCPWIKFEEFDMIKVWVGCQGELLRLRLCVVEINLVATVDVSVLVRQTPEKRATRVLNSPSRWIK